MPYGNINNAKKFSYNKRFSYVGNAYDALNAVNIFSNEKLTEYSKTRNLWIQIIRDSDSATLDVTYDAANKAAALTWSAGTDSYISKRYSQVNGATDITISSASDQELVITGGAWVVNTAKYCLFEPSKSTLSVMDVPLSVNGRMKNKALAACIIQKDDKVAVSGYTSDYVFPIKCSAGLMDFGWTNLSNIFWYLVGGETSTSARPGVTLSAGVSYSFGTNMLAGNISLKSNGTGTSFIGDLKDLQKLTYKLDLGNCSHVTGNLSYVNGITWDLYLVGCALITGHLSDLNPNLSGFLSLSGCTLITGDLSNLGGKLTAYLLLSGCTLITGDLSSLGGNIQYILNIEGCNLITGVYTPNSATTTPTTFNVANTGMSASDVDNTLIACDNPTVARNGVTFTKTGLSRTSASDAAKLDLKTNHSWTFDPDT